MTFIGGGVFGGLAGIGIASRFAANRRGLTSTFIVVFLVAAYMLARTILHLLS